MAAALRYLVKKFYVLCAVLLIGLAVLVQCGRSFAPLVEKYPNELAQYLSSQLGMEIRFESIRADWQGLKPSLEVDELIIEQEGRRLLAAQSAYLRLDLLGSLRHLQLAWGKIQLRGTRLSLSQNPDGGWGLPGTGQAQPGLAPEDLLTLVELGTRVEFQDTHIALTFADQRRLAFVAPSLLLENRGDFHRLSLELDLEEADAGISAVIEGRGSPGDQRAFQTRGYLELRQLPTEQPFNALEQLYQGEVQYQDWYQNARANARIWFQSLPQGQGYSVTGQWKLEDLSLPLKDQMLTQLSSDLTGSWVRSGQWQLGLQELHAQWGEQQLSPINLATAVAGPQAPVQIMMDRLNLEYWTNLLDQVGVLGEGRLQQVVRTLAPRGRLLNLQLSLPREGFKNWQLTAELDQLVVNPWEGVPGFTGVDGFVNADQKGGRLDLNSQSGFSMHFAKTYAAPMAYQSARGQVAWYLAPEDNQLYVNSGPIKLEAELESATGHFWLSMPWQRNTGDIDLFLDIQAQRMAAGLYAKYLPQNLPPGLRRWLDDSLGNNNSGRVTQGSFLFRGTLNTPNPLARTHQLRLAFEITRLKYHPDWPQLTEVSGQLWLDDVELDATLTQGEIYNSKIETAQVHMGPNPDGEGPLLSIEGQVDGIASDGLRLLRESALRRYIGDHMDTWYAHGDLEASLSLTVPLVEGAPGRREQLTLNLNAPKVAMDNFNLEMRDLKGEIHYSSEAGLKAESLSAVLFDQPLQASITSAQSTEGVPQTILELNGAAEIDRLIQWTQRPELKFLSGKLDYQTRIELNHRPEDASSADQRVAALSVRSDLQGVAVDLPAPLGKQAQPALPLQVNMIFGRQTLLLDVHYAQLAQALLQLDAEDYSLLRANLALNQPASLPGEPSLRLSGRLEQLDIDAWQSVWQRYLAYTQTSATDSEVRETMPLDPSLLLAADLTLGEYQLGPLTLKELELDLESRPDGWFLSLANDRIKGDLRWYANERPLELDLDYLHLEPELFVSLDQSAEQRAFDPRELPAAQVDLAQLSIADEDYGSWSFRLLPDQEGAHIEALVGGLKGLKFGGLDGEEGARLDWLYDDQGQQQTRFSGLIMANNMADVMRAWGQPELIESQSASYSAQVHWRGGPRRFSPENLVGDLVFELQEGRFARNPAGGSDGLLRLFAVLNFDSLARRLRLDFSDLYQSGLAYDSIQGQAHFDRGQVEFREPLQVRSPSSRLQLVGRVDLNEETLDARLVATLPVAGNLTFLTALAAGLPAAAGVYIVSKLFEKQVDQATSISYRIRGDWDDPKIKFDRMFEGDVSLDGQQD